MVERLEVLTGERIIISSTCTNSSPRRLGERMIGYDRLKCARRVLALGVAAADCRSLTIRSAPSASRLQTRLRSPRLRRADPGMDRVEIEHSDGRADDSRSNPWTYV